MFKNNIIKNKPAAIIAVLTGAFLLGSADQALAASTLGDIFCNAFVNAKPFGKVFQWVAYVAGAAAALSGVHHLRLHTEDSRNHPLNRGLMLLFGAAGLLALPETIGAVVTSIYGSGGGASGALTCTGGTSSSSSGSGLDYMLVNFVGNIKGPMLSVISLTAILCGLLMMIRGIMKASKYGFDPKANSVHNILTHMGFGALLLTIGDNLPMMVDTLFGSSSISTASVINWSGVAGGTSPRFQAAITAALTFVQLIGAISFVRGWMIMKKVVEGGGGNVTMAQGLTHILGGVLAINIFQFLIIMDKTFGTNLL